MRSPSLQPASVSSRSLWFVLILLGFVLLPRRMIRKELQWSVVSVVPSSFCSALLWLKQNNAFFPEDLSCYTVTCPPWHRHYCLHLYYVVLMKYNILLVLRVNFPSTWSVNFNERYKFSDSPDKSPTVCPVFRTLQCSLLMINCDTACVVFWLTFTLNWSS